MSGRSTAFMMAWYWPVLAKSFFPQPDTQHLMPLIGAPYQHWIDDHSCCKFRKSNKLTRQANVGDCRHLTQRCVRSKSQDWEIVLQVSRIVSRMCEHQFNIDLSSLQRFVLICGVPLAQTYFEGKPENRNLRIIQELYWTGSYGIFMILWAAVKTCKWSMRTPDPM